MIKSENKIITVIVGIVIGVLLTILLSPKRIAKLSDGSGEVVSAGDVKISANDYYSVLKREDRLNMLLREINLRLIKNMYPNREEDAKAYAEQQYESFKNQMDLYGIPEADAFKQYGYKDKDDFINYTSEDYYLQTYYEDAMKKNVNVEEVQADYEANYFPTKHIFIFSAENKTELNKVKKQLDKGTNISKVVSNTKVAYNDFDFDFYVTAYGDEIRNQVKNTKVGKTTAIGSSEVFGNYFIYVQAEEEALSFDEVKDDMINEKIYALEEEDSKMTYKVMLDLQKDNNIDFKDEDLKEAYEEYKKEYYQ